ncbi:Stomatin family protein [Acanthamoeba polyphaga mimivirus]|nr:Stomatin family protein [Acanthamoeba castellanii mamavirus]EJN41036.1 hypothetical protein lvs_R533 [Acanthamoeba polyphaga lentillevirus]UMZ07848.1 Stomatin family protein [Acanthamoeba polyphaga mimivirus]
MTDSTRPMIRNYGAIEPESQTMVKDDSELDNFSEKYREPVFASVLRSIGCFLGYACIPTNGLCGRYYPYKSISKGYRGIVQEFGRVKREISDGMHYVNPVTESISQVDMRIKVIDLDKKDVMTSDKLSIKIDSVVYYQVINIHDALFKIDNVVQSIIELSYATLRNVIGNSTLEVCLTRRDKIAESIKSIVSEATNGWGIEIKSIQITDIVVPTDIINSLSSAIVAERQAEAKIILAQGNVKSAELMRQAADMLDSKAAMQVRSLEVIDKLATSNNSKIVFLPTDLNLSTRNNIIYNDIQSTN